MVEKDTYRVIMLASHTSGPLGAGRPTPISYANDLDIGPDGTIYFTDSQAFGPVLNALGFYDTLAACILGLAQARALLCTGGLTCEHLA